MDVIKEVPKRGIYMLNVNIKMYILLFLSTTLAIQAADHANAWYSNLLLNNIKKEHVAVGTLGAAAAIYYLYNRQSAPIEVQRTLRIINSIDPTLYAAIIKVDPTGEEHVKPQETYSGSPFACDISPKDGLPVIYVNKRGQELSDDHFRAIVAHELGHYISGNMYETFGRESEIVHAGLFKTPVSKEFKKGKKVRGQLPARESFNRAYTRVQEYEADRSSILDFGIDVDTAIEAYTILQNLLETKKQRENPLMMTHPLGSKRIDQFKDLAKEVELRKARNEPRPQINWEEHAKRFLKTIKAREAAERRSMLNSLTSQFEDILKKNKDKLEAHEISEMEAVIEKTKSSLKEHEHNADELQKAYDELSQSFDKFAEKLDF